MDSRGGEEHIRKRGVDSETVCALKMKKVRDEESGDTVPLSCPCHRSAATPRPKLATLVALHPLHLCHLQTPPHPLINSGLGYSGFRFLICPCPPPPRFLACFYSLGRKTLNWDEVGMGSLFGWGWGGGVLLVGSSDA
jgi:hypothetical protein